MVTGPKRVETPPPAVNPKCVGCAYEVEVWLNPTSSSSWSGRDWIPKGRESSAHLL